MATEILVATISAIVALIAAAITIWGQTRSAKLQAELRREENEDKRQREAKRLITRYREPLVHAAYDLQSRIYNILKLQLINLHYINGTERSKNYVVNNTAFLIAQYFGWSEIIRQDGLFLDLGELDRTRKLNELQDTITHTWLRDDLGSALCIFRGNQRVIGEEMIKREDGSNCLTYGEFLKALGDDQKTYLRSLNDDISVVIKNIDVIRSRLLMLQHTLVDLIDFLDPNFVRFPQNRRTKISQSDS